MISDAEHLINIEALTEACEDAVRRGNRTVSVELSALGWLAIFDEIKNRRRANYSALIADQHLREMGEILDEMREGVAFMIANGPREWQTDRALTGRSRRRDVASPELLASMRGRANKP